eukprot:GHVO01005009.1.p2 GENE.GHVO01005009.1~~GHVO01005009.1.p2  ORF type:complete len:108 (+),score=3.68 GHVO01005009.1:92-415(+)
MMNTHGFYQPSTRVSWEAHDAYSTFKRWRKEVERIVDGPLATQSDDAKINHIYIWAGAQAEMLIDARLAETTDLRSRNLLSYWMSYKLASLILPNSEKPERSSTPCD